MNSVFYTLKSKQDTGYKPQRYLLYLITITPTSLDEETHDTDSRNEKIFQNVIYRVEEALEHDAKLEDKAGKEQDFQSWSRHPFTLTSMIDAAILHFQIKVVEIRETLNGCNQLLVRFAPTIAHETKLQ